MTAPAAVNSPHSRLRAGLWHGALIAISLIMLVPIVLMVLASFMTRSQFVSDPFALPDTMQWSNYATAWTEANVVVTLRNSVVVTVASVAISTVLAILAAYALARFEFWGKNIIRLLFTAGIVVPVQLIMLPFFVLMRDVGLLGSSWSLIVAYTVFNIPLGVLVMTPFFGVLPKDLEEAAAIDGAGPLKTMIQVMLPLMRPAIATVAILNGIWIWNDFSTALVLATTPDISTLPVGIMSFYGSYSTDWGPIFASVTIATMPMLLAYLLLSRQFIAGLTAGAVKG